MRKVLIANRGEIVGRIARSARATGLQTVAVYSDADRDAWHLGQCDEAVALGGVTPRESYLDVDKLLDAAALVGADAVHPGYGFLSESAAFAREVIAAGLTWIGPSPDVIHRMGDKITAKRLMRDAGVPTLPSAEVEGGVDVAAAGASVGFPLLVKAAAGGGGKGMRLVHSPDDLAEAVASCRREAGAAFNDDRVFLEKFMLEPRHIEVQIFGDAHGNLVHMFERECSIQRRHQKILEESPSPALSESMRAEICAAALVAGRAIDYQNAGTVEFVYGADGSVSFLEVNTRLQVEHPVTEAVTGLDLVALQFAVAEGRPLPFRQEDLVQRGHAIEIRLYAEDPGNDYLPSPGTIAALRRGDVPSVRWDIGVSPGSVVSQYYDPLIAKVIAHGETRAAAAGLLGLELQGTDVHGIRTNQALLETILTDPIFLDGKATTAFLDQYYPANADRQYAPPDTALTFACCAAVVRTLDHRTDDPIPPRWRNNPAVDGVATFEVAEREVSCTYRVERDGSWTISIDGRTHRVVPGPQDDDRCTLEIDGRRTSGWVSRLDQPEGRVSWSVSTRLGRAEVVAHPRFPDRTHVAVPGALTSPMPGSVLLVNVEVGTILQQGELVCVIEAMKMEQRILAPQAGVVTELLVHPGMQVEPDQLLVVLADLDAGEDA